MKMFHMLGIISLTGSPYLGSSQVWYCDTKWTWHQATYLYTPRHGPHQQSCAMDLVNTKAASDRSTENRMSVKYSAMNGTSTSHSLTSKFRKHGKRWWYLLNMVKPLHSELLWLPAQYQTSQHSIMKWGGMHKPQLLTEELKHLGAASVYL